MHDDNLIDKNEEEIELLDLFLVLLRHKKMILTATVFSAIGAVLISIISLLLPSTVSY